MKNIAIMLAVCLVIGVIGGFIVGYKLHGSSDAKQAAKYFTAGKEFYDQKKYPEAVEMLNRSIGLDPSLASAHMLLAGSYQSQGWNELAQKELEKGGGPPEKPGQ